MAYTSKGKEITLQTRWGHNGEKVVLEFSKPIGNWLMTAEEARNNAKILWDCADKLEESQRGSSH